MTYIIHLTKTTKHELDALKYNNETYDEVIQRLIAYEMRNHTITITYE